MSNVNGNDMDDLFKRAADGYPLRTNSSDWSRLAADLDKDPSLILPPLNQGTDKRRRRGIFWLLLLLPVVGGLGFWAWHAGRKGPDVAVHSTAGSDVVGSEAVGKRADAGGKVKAKINEKDFTSVQGSIVVSKNGNGDGATLRTGIGSDETGKKGNGSKPNGPASPGGNEGREKMGVARMAKGNKTGGKETATVKGNKAEADGPATPGGNGSLVEVTGSVARRAKGDEKSVVGGTHMDMDGATSRNAGRSVNRNSSAERSYIHAARVSLKGPYAVNVAVKGKDVVPQKEKEKEKTQKKKPSFYVGVTAGPDLSTIKMQRVSGAGTTFGLILGYNFGNRWGLETGLNLDHKKYYSQGEYFDKSGNPRLTNIDILNLDGYCNMLEIPVNVRYDLGKGEKTRWFATAGLSTYLMNKEHYNYEAKYTGGGPSWPGQWTYKTPHDYWFSILNFSIGYEQKLGNVGNLRLEPYLRIPLSGMGTGKLPIMSTGLNIGFTRRIW